jgi:magnesium-transporting ATPase (P-type)
MPADLLAIKTSNSKGLCYVETKSLDGETNLKTKKVNRTIQQLFEKEQDILSTSYKIDCESPSVNLYHFDGLFSSNT